MKTALDFQSYSEWSDAVRLDLTTRQLHHDPCAGVLISLFFFSWGIS